MQKIDTGLMDIISGPHNTPNARVFTPMTGPLNSMELRSVRFRVFGAARQPQAPVVKPGLQFSNDGINWADDPVAFGYSYSVLKDGWDWSTYSAWAGVHGTAATPRLYVRFGLMSEATSVSYTGAAQARMIVEASTVASWTVEAGPKVVGGSKEDSDPVVFTALTEWLPAKDAVYARPTLDVVQRNSASIEVAPAFQFADDLTDPSSWGAATEFGAAGYQNAVGVVYPETHASITGGTSPSPKQYVRFGVFGRCPTLLSGPGAALVRLRVDVRNLS